MKRCPLCDWCDVEGPTLPGIAADALALQRAWHDALSAALRPLVAAVDRLAGWLA